MEKKMTIKEVENELGIPRATVRFYEKNGLLNPRRDENSYRAYSEEDVAELRRIIILRKLGISVGEIADLQKGNIDLAAALSENLEKLNEQLKEVTGAINMCKKLQCEGTSMAQLSEVKYWEDVEQEEEKGNLFINIAEDLYILGKHTFLNEFGVEDSEGNSTQDTKGMILAVFLQCFACGVTIAVLEAVANKKPFSFESFKEGFVWPFVFVICGFIIELPFYFWKKDIPYLLND